VRRGRLVVLEGGEASGKTTQAERVAERLRAAGLDVVTTIEPGGTHALLEIRALLLHGPDAIDPMAETLLMAADRAQHVVSEDQRVGKFVDACGSGDLSKLGKLFVESHRSLQFDYEVSCEELDFLVDTALSIEGVYGARMTGGGFGGGTVNLIDPAASARFEREISGKYHARYSVRPQVYRCRPSAGASEIPPCTSIH